MPLSDPLGGQKFWINGLPFPQIRKNVSGGQKFWFEGLPVQGLFSEGEIILGSGSLVFSTFIPVATININDIINITNINLNFSTFVPEIIHNCIREPSGDDLSFSTFIPILSGPISLIIMSKNLSLSTYGPEINYTNVGPEIPRSIRIAGSSGNEIILIEIDLWRS